MATPVEESEPIPQEEDGMGSLNDFRSEPQKQPGESEVPVSINDVTIVKEDPVSDDVAKTARDGDLGDNPATTVCEGPVSNEVVVTFVETSVSNLKDSQLSQERQLDIVKVDEGPVSNNFVMGEDSVSNGVVVVAGEGSVCNNIVPVTCEGSVSNSLVVMDDGCVGNSLVVACESSVNTSIVRVPPEKRTLYKFGQRTSNYRGVTRHRWTGKYEAHLWDNSTITEGRKRKGKQVYLGGYESEEKAAQAYDLAALKYWGAVANTKLNFPLPTYEKELEEMKDMSREEYVNSLRRKSICFTRGHSIYRGVTRQNEGRRWQARIGRVAGGKDIYLGTYDTEEEAAEAYDIAAVKLRGMNAITNFDISNYYKEGTKELDVIPIKTIEEESSHLRIRYFTLAYP